MEFLIFSLCFASFTCSPVLAQQVSPSADCPIIGGTPNLDVLGLGGVETCTPMAMIQKASKMTRFDIEAKPPLLVETGNILKESVKTSKDDTVKSQEEAKISTGEASNWCWGIDCWGRRCSWVNGWWGAGGGWWQCRKSWGPGRCWWGSCWWQHWQEGPRTGWSRMLATLLLFMGCLCFCLACLRGVYAKWLGRAKHDSPVNVHHAEVVSWPPLAAHRTFTPVSDPFLTKPLPPSPRQQQFLSPQPSILADPYPQPLSAPFSARGAIDCGWQQRQLVPSPAVTGPPISLQPAAQFSLQPAVAPSLSMYVPEGPRAVMTSPPCGVPLKPGPSVSTHVTGAQALKSEVRQVQSAISGVARKPGKYSLATSRPLLASEVPSHLWKHGATDQFAQKDASHTHGVVHSAREARPHSLPIGGQRAAAPQQLRNMHTVSPSAHRPTSMVRSLPHVRL